jgi:hypothetical protein
MGILKTTVRNAVHLIKYLRLRTLSTRFDDDTNPNILLHGVPYRLSTYIVLHDLEFTQQTKFLMNEQNMFVVVMAAAVHIF